MKEKKYIKNIIIFIVLIVITFFFVFKNYDLNSTIAILKSSNLLYIIIGIIVMFFYFVLETINIRSVLHALGKKTKMKTCLKYPLIGFFFSGITPAASGGQPLEIYFMNKDGIKVSDATISLLIELSSFQIITITCGIIGAIINYDLLASGFIWMFIVGTTLNSFALIIMLICFISPITSEALAELLIKVMRWLKVKNIEEKKKKIDQAIKDYQQGASFIKKNKMIIVKSLFIVSSQVTLYYFIPVCVYKALGLSGESIFHIMSVYAMLFIAVSSIPIPGTVGVNEASFLKIFALIFTAERISSAMLLNRFISFYVFIIIGLILTYINIKKSNRSIS